MLSGINVASSLLLTGFHERCSSFFPKTPLTRNQVKVASQKRCISPLHCSNVKWKMCYWTKMCFIRGIMLLLVGQTNYTNILTSMNECTFTIGISQTQRNLVVVETSLKESENVALECCRESPPSLINGLMILNSYSIHNVYIYQPCTIHKY